MATRIVIALKRHDRIESLLPCIEKITRPGMRVVFLLPYPVEFWAFLNHWIDIESATKTMLAGGKTNHRYSWELQRGLAERKIAPAQESLRAMEVEAAVHVYTGSLKKLLRAFTLEQESPLIMISRGAGRWRRIVGKIPLLRFLERPGFPPVVLLQV